jgi:hypothetical protein
MKTTIQHLNYTKEQLEDLKMRKYLGWCTSFCTDYGPGLQKIVANRAISNFFNKQWEACENEFIECMNEYPNTPLDEKLKTFNRCLVQLHNRNPKGLIGIASKTNIINDDYEGAVA